MNRRMPYLMYQRKIMRVKEKIGPLWEEINKIPEKDQSNYVADILTAYFPSYLNDVEGARQDAREALRQLRVFFKSGPMKGLDRESKQSVLTDVPIIDEEIPEVD